MTNKNEPLRTYYTTQDQQRDLRVMHEIGKPNTAWEELGRELEFRPDTVSRHKIVSGDGNVLSFDARPTSRVHERVTEDLVRVAADNYPNDDGSGLSRTMAGMRKALTAVFDRLDADLDPVGSIIATRSSANITQPARNLSIAGSLTVHGELKQRESIAARGNPPAPRVTLEHLESLVVDEHYHVYRTLTICVLTLRNGYTVSGESASVDPANFDRQKGREIARSKALGSVWPLEGYLLRERLHEAESQQAL